MVDRQFLAGPDQACAAPTIPSVALVSETITVSGVRCERCVGRLAGALRGHEGLEYANANLMGDVNLAWDEEKTSRDEILAALARSGFAEVVREDGIRPGGFPSREDP